MADETLPLADETLLSKLMNGAVTEGDGDLLNLVIRDGVTELGCLEFYNHKRLASVKIPSSVTEIDDLAFQDCTSLSSVEIPPSVKTIGSWAFKGCTSLESLVIPESLTEIGEEVFWDCESLSSVTIPAGVKKIGRTAFYCCASLTELKYNGTTEQLRALDWDMGHLAVQCTDGLVVDLSSWTKINERVRVLTLHRSVEHLYMAAGLEQIDKGAFDGCTSLKNIIFNGTMAQWEAVKKAENWNKDVPAKTVKCSDGEVKLEYKE